MIHREEWEHELTRVIDVARNAGLPDVVLAIQNAITHINHLKRDRESLRTLKSILNRKHP